MSGSSPTLQSIQRGNSPTFSFEQVSPTASASDLTSSGNNPDTTTPTVSTTVAPDTTTPTMSTTVAPKFGGLYDASDTNSKIIWVGGPPKANWSSTILTTFATPMCIRGIGASAEIKGYAKRVLDGLETKFKQDDDDFGLLSFASKAKSHMETHGMDTVFYMRGTDDLTTNRGEELFTYHSKYTREQVKKHVEDKISDNTFDQHANTALTESANWL